MNQMAFIASASLLCGALQACNPAADASAQPPKDWAPAIQKLQADLEAAQKNIQDLTVAKNYAELRLNALEGNDFAQLTLGENGFSVVRTRYGSALVTYDKVTPTADGFELLLRIGNLTGATFDGVKVGLNYGPPAPQTQNGVPPTTDQWKDFSARQQHKDFDLTTNIVGNRWNYIKLVVAPAKPDEVRQISVSLDFTRLSLVAGPLP